MAKYTVTHACGHECRVNLFGPHKDRDRKIEWLKTQDCFECERRAVHNEAVKHAEENNLPALEGSEKQINWAMDIRYAAAEGIRSICRPDNIAQELPGRGYHTQADADLLGINNHETMLEFVAKVYQTAIGNTSAKWWIEHRDMTAHSAYHCAMDKLAPRKYLEPNTQGTEDGIGITPRTRTYYNWTAQQPQIM